MESIDIDIEVSSEVTHDIVTFTIENYRTSAVGVRLRQPLPGDVSTSQVATMAKYEGDSWKISEDALEFDHEIDWGLVVETAYAIKDVERTRIEEMIAETVIEVYDREGTKIETGTGLELRSEEESGGTDADGTRIEDLPEPGGDADGDESEPETTSQGDSDAGPGTVETRSTAARSGDVEADQRSDGVSVGDPDDDPFSAEWSRARAGERSHENSEARRDSEAHEVTPDDEPGAPEDSETASLPDVPASFILEDVSDDIQPGEFTWIPIEGDDTPAGEGSGDQQSAAGRTESPTDADGQVEDRPDHDEQVEDRADADGRVEDRADADDSEVPDGSGGLFSRVRSWFG